MTDKTMYWVYLLDYQGDDYGLFLVGKFVCKGDAFEYAIHRAHTIPEGKHQVFEVYKVVGAKRERLYRAG